MIRKRHKKVKHKGKENRQKRGRDRWDILWRERERIERRSNAVGHKRKLESTTDEHRSENSVDLSLQAF